MSAIDPKQAEQEELVAEWLRATPGFFDRYADLFNEIRLKHPHEDRAISLQERQMTVLRTQNQELNRRLGEMLHFGSRNDKTQQSLVAWLLRLMKANTKADVEGAITSGLAEVFEVESAQLLASLPSVIFDGLTIGVPAVGAPVGIGNKIDPISWADPEVQGQIRQLHGIFGKIIITRH